MENIFKNGGSTLKQYFDNNIIDSKVFANLGQTIGYVQKSIGNVILNEHPIFPESRYIENLKYRIGMINNKNAERLIDDLMSEKMQVILGDLAPKNIGILPNGGIKLFDLDLIAIGNRCFDIGYLTGHLILETYRYGTDALKGVLGSFFRGYKSYINDGVIEDTKTLKVAIASIIYRLDNSLIPYPINLNFDQRNHLISKAYNLFNSDKVNWYNLINP